MKISEIYKKYDIPENLQQHMYRVAAVGFLVAGYLEKTIELDKDIIVTELLLHDMGNIIKYDFGKSIVFSPEETARLKKVRTDFITKYGEEEHVATIKIAQELGVPEKVLEIMSMSGSSNLQSALESSDWYRKVCSYADFRVGPHGIVSVVERFDDILKRYEGRNHTLSDKDRTLKKKQNAILLEKQIQDLISISLLDINDKLIEPIVRGFYNYEI
jgi:hypothetical protein